jgi:hypothetical protein
VLLITLQGAQIVYEVELVLSIPGGNFKKPISKKTGGVTPPAV